MGNKIVRSREFIDDCTEASGFCKDADQRKLRLNMNGELAPRHSGAEEYAPELDECPICFLFYPSLNRSICCSKSICTDCYMQIKSADYSSQANCPFCKTSNYMVEYRGAKTEEEKFSEQAEEQKVIEAKIRIRQKELRDEEDSLLRYGKRIPAEERYVASRRGGRLHADDDDNWNLDQFKESFELEESQLFGQDDFDEEHGQQEIVGHSSGEDGAPMDMEQALLMKAIWLSIQDQTHRNQVSAVSPQTFHRNAMQGGDLKRRRARSSGLEESAEMRGQAASGSEILLGQATLPHRRSLNCLDFNTRTSTIEIPQRYSGVCEPLVEDKALALGKRNIQNLRSSMQEGSHDEMGCLSTGTAYVIPETYDEQIMLAVALSLADEHAQGR